MQKSIRIIIFCAFFATFFDVSLGRIRKMSASDAPSVGYAYAMVIKKYPAIPDLISARSAELETTETKGQAKDDESHQVCEN